MEWTEKQAEAINYRGGNLMVAAAAGSGKTAVLVERITTLILEKSASIDEMLVVTFTNAAAAGMKDKITASIRKRIEEDAARGDYESLEYMKNQLSLLHDANISTFDSFVQKVVKENFQIVDIDPGVRVCDDDKSQILKNQALDEIFSEELEKAEPGFIAFLDAYSEAKSFESVKNTVYDFYTTLRALPEPMKRLEEYVMRLNCTEEDFANSPVLESAICLFNEEFKHIAVLIDRAANVLPEDEFPTLRGKLQNELDWAKLITDEFFKMALTYEALPGDSSEENTKTKKNALEQFLNVLYMDPPSVVLRATKDEKAAYEEVKDALSAIRTEYKDLIKKEVKPFFEGGIVGIVNELNEIYPSAKVLAGLIQSFDKKFLEKKLDRGMLDFGDFMHLALEILSKDSIAAQYKDRFRYIFIDEYQDSNELQEALVERLSKGDNLFMVGDVKQSIYRFRQAEAALFMGRYKRYKACEASKSAATEEGKVIDLNANFRSKGKIIDFINRIFRSLMDGYDSDAELHKGNKYEGELDYEPEVAIVTMEAHSEGSGNNKEDAATDEAKALEADLKRDEAEAINIAGIIRSQINNHEKIAVFENGEFVSRPIRYKDVVILMRSTKSAAETYKKVFREFGIPLSIEQNDGYFDTIEVEVFLNLLKTIDNIRQDVPLISVLFSPVFGFTADELARIRAAKKGYGVPFYEAFFSLAKAEGDLALKCKNAYSKIRRWKKESRMMHLNDFIWKLYNQTGYYIYAGALPGGAERQTNLRILADRALKFSEEGSGIYAFLRDIEAIKKNKVKVPPANTLGENADAVRVMTIHKSKGLEFPVTIVAGLHRAIKIRDDVEGMQFNKKFGMALNIRDVENLEERETRLKSLIRKQNSLEERQELARLLYVAFTRAVDKLIISAVVKNYDASKSGDDGKSGWLAQSDAGAMELQMGKSYLDWIMPPLFGSGVAGEYESAYNISVKPAEGLLEVLAETKTVGIEKEGEKRRLDDVEISEAVREKLAYRYPYEDEFSIKSKYSVSELNEGAAGKYRKIPKPDEDGEYEDAAESMTAAEKGTVYHLIMEHMDFSDLSKCNPQKTLDELIEKGLADERSAGEIKIENIEKFLTSELAGRMSVASRAGKLWKEKPFTLKVEHLGKEILVQGIIDCFFEEEVETEQGMEKVFVLVDYKSNYVVNMNSETKEHFTKLYGKQIELYAKALSDIKEKRVAQRYLFMLSAGEAIEL